MTTFKLSRLNLGRLVDVRVKTLPSRPEPAQPPAQRAAVPNLDLDALRRLAERSSRAAAYPWGGPSVRLFEPLPVDRDVIKLRRAGDPLDVRGEPPPVEAAPLTDEHRAVVAWSLYVCRPR